MNVREKPCILVSGLKEPRDKDVIAVVAIKIV